MKETLITILRDKKTDIEDYRRATEKIATILAIDSAKYLSKLKISLSTPLVKTTGITFIKELVLVPVLRAGLAMLPAFLQTFPFAKVGFLGIKRDEKTFFPQLYYTKLPSFKKNEPLFILDPMIATGGSASLAIHILKEAGVKESQITLIGIIASPQGIKHIKKEHPKVTHIVAQVDKGLDKNRWIIPGLGDFGDRYFGST